MTHKPATRSMFRAAAFCLVAMGMFVPQAAHAVVTNLALDGTASQSSTGFGGVASRGNDGNTDGVYNNGSVTHTNNQQGAFWEVDLGIKGAIDEIVLYNRSDCCGNRLSNFTVSVFDLGGTEVFSEVFAGAVAQGGTLSLDPAGVEGTRVRVQLNGSNFLSLAEVEVLGEEIPEPATAAMAMLGLAGVAMRRRRRNVC